MAEQFATYRTRADLEKLLADGLVESLQIEFKASDALTRDGNKPNELCITVSAMANSAGGQIFYCIDEAKKTKGPVRVDDGVADPKVTREWIEQILLSRVHPHMNGVRIDPIDLGDGKRGFVISLPQTHTGPHQAPDNRYYKRFELQARAMEDYEVRDILRRATTPEPFVTLSFPAGNRHRLNFGREQEQSDAFGVFARISNRSSTPAYHAIVDIGLDRDLLLASKGNYDSLGQYPDGSGFAMNWYRAILSSPPTLPIFKEHTMAIVPNDLHFYLRSSALMGRPYFDITVLVSAPGFSSEEHWAIQASGGTLIMHRPGTEMTDRTKG
jgi:hypothetical protein